MRTIQDAFMADIVANPEDDTPRLIYADWLDDHGGEEGEARAEFIRVQVELASPELESHEDDELCPACRRVRELREREDELIRFNAYKWIDAALPPELQEGFGTWTHKAARIKSKGSQIRELEFHRGFVAEVHAPLATLQEHLPRLVQEHPITRAVATDKQAQVFGEDGNHVTEANPPGMFVWWVAVSRNSINELPEDVWEAVDAEPDREYRNYKQFPTAEAANDALSRALLALARRS